MRKSLYKTNDSLRPSSLHHVVGGWNHCRWLFGSGQEVPIILKISSSCFQASPRAFTTNHIISLILFTTTPNSPCFPSVPLRAPRLAR